MKRNLFLIATVILSGCATTLPSGLLYQEATKNLLRVESGKSRLTLFRPAEGKQKSKADAHIKIDGTPAESVIYGSFIHVDIPVGKHEASVKAFGTSTCNVGFEAASGEELFFEIMPRASINSGWFILGIVGAVAGSAIESSGKDCGGEFAIRKVDAEYAIKKLAGIRQNEK